MKNTLLKSIKSMTLIGFFMLIVWACQDENIDKLDSKTQASNAAQDNSQIVATTQEVMNITANAFTARGLTGGRVAHGDHDDDDDDNDNNNSGECKPSISGTFSLDRTHPDSLIYSGTFIIDFGDGSSCPDSTNIRKGKVIDEFTWIISFKDSITFTSTETITFEGFYKDSTQLDGKFVIKSSTGHPTTIEAQDAKITYADGTFFSWDGTLSYSYEKSGSRHCKGKLMKVTGALSGTTRAGQEFTATITREIVFKRGCSGRHSFIPVSGTVEVTTGGTTSVIDYGDGSCDKHFTITTGGVPTEHIFS
jgi:hypothetical protein